MNSAGVADGTFALITGANKGIGYEIARGLGEKKITVLMGSRGQARGQAAADCLRAEGLDARFIEIDVTRRDTILSAAEWIQNQFGKLDILVNNAGIAERMAKPSEADLAAIHKIYETNLFGPMAVTQAMLPLLRRSQRGRIVNVSSSLGSLTLARDPTSPVSQFLVLGYNTSKTALNSMTVQFANELRDTPIKVNAVCPGYCATDINTHSGPRTAKQGAVAPVQLATIPDDGPSGGFFNEDGPVPW